MLIPKRLKYRKQYKGRIKGKASKGNYVAFGDYGISAAGKGKLTSRQIEAARIAINRYLKRGGKVVIRIFPHKPVTSKPLEVRQGKGKGAVEFYVAPVKEGTILYEVGGVTEEQAREAFRRAAHKLPIKCKFVKRDDIAEAAE
ncbi:ribosomal protein L16 [Denitrovibrio acetiphilus DSM 12809]|uniref:Large ribosomal subunit protein uL16 n=1 Tax=Denitrovibrio acetiphilus (strain DSM 12809 / NBRC 114555 / N2460) TaxID=522772 RepID=D4H395_DENA2|nr:50S ribosomal protein L16 [Denitrovibrio acetiphilus]ADD67179.1 ribosomal protein L16 [Denitrovibrio acetiphilus DSM 12809]